MMVTETSFSDIEVATMAANMNAETCAGQQVEILRLREALHDIHLGARMMLDSPVMEASLKRYAQEVARVAMAGLGSKARG